MPKQWNLNASLDAPAELESWAGELGISPFLARLLWQRGLKGLREMDLYLSPGLRHLALPSACPGLDDAAATLAAGLGQGLKFAVWGDYDVDGVTSTALVLDFMARRGIPAMHHLPNRLREGYGLNVEGIEELADAGVRLLLTVDCGITSTREVARARELGMTVVVSDHHLPGAELPDAHAVCNPRLAACCCESLAGVGVSFLLMAALNRLLPGDPLDMRQFLDLVALGTLADIVELRGQNRILVKNGLLLIASAARPGLAALKEASGYAPAARLDAGQVVFGLAPRINAAGRMGEAEQALRLLLAPDRDTARPLAEALDRMNKERQAEEEEILNQALVQAEEQAADRLGLVLFEPGWHHGIIGIVASRIVERFFRPTLILSRDGDGLKGSGRSIPAFDLYEALVTCGDVLTGFGGHRQAAGLSLREENLDLLRERFHLAVRDQLGSAPQTPTLRLDAELGFERIDFTLLKELELLQPFGMGNPEPVFLSPLCEVRSQRVFGKNHVTLQLKDKGSNITLRAKAWRMAEAMGEVAGTTMRVAFVPKIDNYNGLATIELNVKDWQNGAWRESESALSQPANCSAL